MGLSKIGIRVSKNWSSLFLYIFTIGLVSGSNFITTPFLVRLLDADSFASWSVMEPVILALVPFAGLGMNIGVIKLAGHLDDQRQSLDSLFFPYVLVASTISAVGGCIAFFLTNKATDALLITALIFLEGLILLFISYWRGRNQPGLYALVEGGRCLTMVLLLGATLAVSPMKISTSTDYLLIRVGIGVLALILAYGLVRPPIKINTRDVRKAVEFGFPIVLASMFTALLVSVDRYAVANYGNSTDVVEYVTHIKLAQILSSAVAPYFAWFAPIAIRRLPEGKNAHFFFATSFYYFCVITMIICSGLWFSAPTIWSILFPEVIFSPSLFGVSIVSIGILALGNPLSIGTLQDRKTTLAAVISIASCAITIVLCFSLMKHIGTLGVVLGRLMGSVLYTVLFAAVTMRLTGIEYPFRKLILVGIISLSYCSMFLYYDLLENTLYALGGGAMNIVLVGLLSYSFRPAPTPKGAPV